MTLGLMRQRPGELPIEVTGFVGRQRELAELSGLLSSARLVTVTGPGGVGKTRVALRCAAAVASRFADGVCLAELSALRDPELLPHTVATALGLPENDERSELDAILDYLRGRELLLVLDTCEHLVDACAMFAEVLLRAAPGLRVLATSRQPLDGPGEHARAIAPLPLPDDAVELFAQRAAAVVPGFVIATSLFGYWQMSARLREGGYWLGKVLDRFAAPSAERARALIVHGNLAILRGEAGPAEATVAEAIRIAEQIGDRTIASYGQMYLCLALLTLGRYEEALTAGVIAEQGATEAGDRPALTFIDYEMAYLHLLTGKFAEGLARCDRGLARYGPDSGELWIRGFLYLLKGLGLYLTGEHAASTAAFGRGLAMKHEVGDAMGTGYALEGIALLAAAAGRPTRVAWLLGAAGEIWQVVGGRLGRDPFLEALHEQAERGARDALGEPAFALLRERGARAPLDQIVALAVADADDLAGAEPAGDLAYEWLRL